MKPYLYPMFFKATLLLSLVACTLYSYCQNSDIFKPASIRKEIEAIQISTSLHIDELMSEPVCFTPSFQRLTEVFEPLV